MNEGVPVVVLAHGLELYIGRVYLMDAYSKQVVSLVLSCSKVASILE